MNEKLSSKPSASADSEPAADGSASPEYVAFKDHVIDLFRSVILRTHTQAEAIKEVSSVTKRSRAAVVNWLNNRLNLPDAYAIRNLLQHYRIDPRAVFQWTPEGGATWQGNQEPSMPASRSPAASESVHRGSGIPLVDFLRREPTLGLLLTRYSPHPESCALILQETDEMAEDIRKGELVLVDTSVDSLAGTGTYALRRGGRTFVRLIEQKISEDIAVLRCGNPRYRDETVRVDTAGTLEGLQVLGKVVGSIKQL
jgi:hypothetical protein